MNGMIQVGSFAFTPWALIFPFMMGAACGLVADVICADALRLPIRLREVSIAVTLSGLWWAGSAIFPQAGFPLVFFRSLGGALLLGILPALAARWRQTRQR